MSIENILSGLAIGAVLLAATGCAPVEPISNEEATTSTEAAKEAVVVAHLPSTPVALRTEIDEAVEIVTDPWAGAAARRAMTRLKKIGAPAVPSLLARMIRLDFMNQDERCAMPMLTEVALDIVNSEPCGTPIPMTMICRVGMYGSEAQEVEACERCRGAWLRWWNSSDGRSLVARADAALRVKKAQGTSDQ